jgi:hypothetical protein
VYWILLVALDYTMTVWSGDILFSLGFFIVGVTYGMYRELLLRVAYVTSVEHTTLKEIATPKTTILVEPKKSEQIH